MAALLSLLLSYPCLQKGSRTSAKDRAALVGAVLDDDGHDGHVEWRHGSFTSLLYAWSGTPITRSSQRRSSTTRMSDSASKA
jgi:hypothetical protein